MDKTEQGFTLLEVLIAILILGLIVVAFVNVFGTTFVNIHTIGQRDAAVAEASRIMESLYIAQGEDGLEVGDITTILTNAGVAHNDYDIDPVQLLNDVEGYLVTFSVPYHNGQRSVSLESFLRGR